MKYYIDDTTLGKKSKPILYNTLTEVINHLEGTCIRFGQTRTAYMQNLAELGHPADEPSGKNFLEAMSEKVDVGIIKDNRFCKCNIFAATHYGKYKTEMGD